MKKKNPTKNIEIKDFERTLLVEMKRSRKLLMRIRER